MTRGMKVSDAVVGEKHPAKYSQSILDALGPILRHRIPCRHGQHAKILDPMAGVGKIHLAEIRGTGAWTLGGELELPWARVGQELGSMIVHDARHMPFADRTFDAVVVSPDYGNRMADHHKARDGSTRHTYTHYARNQGWELRPETTCREHWGKRYWLNGAAIAREMERVLAWDGVMVVNVKNFTRRGEQVDVVGWWTKVVSRLVGDVQVKWVETPGLRHGQNHQVRDAREALIVGQKDPF